MNCLNCGKEVKQTEGKRQKLYCDNNGKCKNEYFRKNREIRKVVLVEDENGLWKTSDGRKCNLIWQENKIISPDSELPKEFKPVYPIEYTANLSPLNSKDNKTQAKEVKGAKMGVEVPNDLKESKSWIDKLQDNVDNQIKPTNLAELKALCPKNLVGWDRTVWIEENKSKYNL
jgi:hypothetical protein